MRRHPTAPVKVAGISVATSGTDFTARGGDFAALRTKCEVICQKCYRVYSERVQGSDRLTAIILANLGRRFRLR
jgi:hypothetical protein